MQSFLAKKYYKRSAGFTLIELMVVVGLIAVLAAIAIPNFQGMVQAFKAQTTAEGIYTMAKTAKTMAERNGNNHFFHIDRTNNEVQVYSDSNSNGVIDVNVDRLVQRYVFESGMIIGPSAGYSAEPLPAPYSFIVADSESNFVDTNGGTLVFTSEGKVFHSDFSAIDGAAYLTVIPLSEAKKGNRTHIKLIAIIGQTGDVILRRH